MDPGTVTLFTETRMKSAPRPDTPKSPFSAIQWDRMLGPEHKPPDLPEVPTGTLSRVCDRRAAVGLCHVPEWAQECGQVTAGLSRGGTEDNRTASGQSWNDPVGEFRNPETKPPAVLPTVLFPLGTSCHGTRDI